MIAWLLQFVFTSLPAIEYSAEKWTIFVSFYFWIGRTRFLSLYVRCIGCGCQRERNPIHPSTKLNTVRKRGGKVVRQLCPKQAWFCNLSWVQGKSSLQFYVLTNMCCEMTRAVNISNKRNTSIQLKCWSDRTNIDPKNCTTNSRPLITQYSCCIHSTSNYGRSSLEASFPLSLPRGFIWCHYQLSSFNDHLHAAAKLKPVLRKTTTTWTLMTELRELGFSARQTVFTSGLLFKCVLGCPSLYHQTEGRKIRW